MEKRRVVLVLALCLAACAVAMRVHNAFAYFPLFGFDAIFHWRYVEALLATGQLPDPETGWSASRPPLFFSMAAAIASALGRPEMRESVVAVRLVSSAIGLLPAALAADLVWRVDRARPERALLAAALVVFLPAHIYMSAMFNEEILVAGLTSLALYAACRWQLLGPGAHDAPRAAAALAVGVAAGLATMTKLTGSLAAAAGIGAPALAAWRRGELRRALPGLALALLLVAVLGGWFYARHALRYGYLVPYSLEAHQQMYVMPPGDRHLSDYLRVPLSTFTDPRAVTLDLQRSIWGSTYASLWFDSHRFFMPRDHPNVGRVGCAILVLALLPSAAFFAGLARAARRARADACAVELPMLVLTALTLVGYVAYTWRNPWYATVKGSYLLGLCVPFAFLASEVLVDWAGGRGGPGVAGGGSRLRAWLVYGALAALALAVAAAFTFDTPLWEWGPPRTRMPGFPYQVPRAP